MMYDKEMSLQSHYAVLYYEDYVVDTNFEAMLVQMLNQFV
jgi:hypothetical protein